MWNTRGDSFWFILVNCTVCLEMYVIISYHYGEFFFSSENSEVGTYSNNVFEVSLEVVAKADLQLQG